MKYVRACVFVLTRAYVLLMCTCISMYVCVIMIMCVGVYYLEYVVVY